MHDLRKQVLLESGKTLSRKARSRQSTPASSKQTSPATSRAASRSRATSRAGSDDDGDGELSDETSFSVGSIDEMLNGDSLDASTDAWRAELADRMEEILARKGSTNIGREKVYKTFTHLLRIQYAAEEIRGKEADLVATFLRSIREERSEKEALLAAKAIAVLLLTSPSDVLYESTSGPLKRAIYHSTSVAIKTGAIHAMSICTFYGGASDEGILDTMEFFLEVVTSDGHLIDAPDSAEAVSAALVEYGFLATLVDDLSESSEDAIEAFAEQLSSTHPQVQIAAGENIALLYEKSFKPYNPDEDSALSSYPTTDILTDPDLDSDPSIRGPTFLRLYPAYRRTDQLTHTLSNLANLNTHHVSKSAKKELRSSFADVLNSVSYPTRTGPRYQNAIDQETGKRYGSRMVVKIHKEGTMKIDRWWKLVRLQGLRRVLQGGFVGHYERNPVVFETLPIFVTSERTGRT